MPKAKRVITEFNFDEVGASVHLVSKEQGGAANGFTTLIKKSNSTNHLPDIEDINIQKKLEQIRVTMSMEDFLCKFFGMYSSDAEMLTKLLGFETEYEHYMSQESNESPSYSDYLTTRLDSFELMKSMYEGNFENVSASDIVTILELQEKLESKLKEEMMDKITIEKSRFSELEAAEQELATKIEVIKSLEAAKATLEEQLEEIKKAQADAELEAMKGRLEGLVEGEKIERMAKSLLSMDKEVAEDFIQTLVAKKSAIENSDLFKEVSVDGEKEELTPEQEKELKMKKALEQAHKSKGL